MSADLVYINVLQIRYALISPDGITANAEKDINEN